MFDLHKNPRPYTYAPHVKFHIQNVNDVSGVAICGGIYRPERFSVFSAAFVFRFDKKNQCACCVAEYERSLNLQTQNA
ncbi:MAG: hypothetical protein ABL869_05390 [Candidatus Nitrotoga sp.]